MNPLLASGNPQLRHLESLNNTPPPHRAASSVGGCRFGPGGRHLGSVRLWGTGERGACLFFLTCLEYRATAAKTCIRVCPGLFFYRSTKKTPSF